MSATRVDYAERAPDLFQKYLAFSMGVKKAAGLGAKLLHLVDIRVSQLNGCAFCVDMHVKQAKIAGERELRLHHVAIWRESPLFDARERAAFAWAEALTRLGEHGVDDALYADALAQFGETGLAELTFAVMAINGWNRASVAFRVAPGSRDAAYGLDKAGLS